MFAWRGAAHEPEGGGEGIQRPGFGCHAYFGDHPGTWRRQQAKEALIYSVPSLRAAFSRERSVAGSNPEFMQYQGVMDRHVATLLAMTELFSVSLTVSFAKHLRKPWLHVHPEMNWQGAITSWLASIQQGA